MTLITTRFERQPRRVNWTRLAVIAANLVLWGGIILALKALF